MKQPFLVTTKTDQAQYVKISNDVDQDATKMCTFLKGPHIEDITDGMFQQLKNNISAIKKVKKDEDQHAPHTDKPSGHKPCASDR